MGADPSTVQAGTAKQKKQFRKEKTMSKKASW